MDDEQDTNRLLQLAKQLNQAMQGEEREKVRKRGTACFSQRLA